MVKIILEKLIAWYLRWFFNLNKNLSSFEEFVSEIFSQEQINSLTSFIYLFILKEGLFLGQQQSLIIGRKKKIVNKVQRYASAE